MNKKVSTIFAMAALMGGVFSGSAYAQTPVLEDPIAFPISSTPLEEMSSPVILRQGNVSFGFTRAEGAEYSKLSVITDVTTEPVEKTQANNYTWNVITTPADDTREYPVYMFVNAVTKDTLSFDKADGHLIIAGSIPSGQTKKEWAKTNYYTFAFEKTVEGVLTGVEFDGAANLLVEATKDAAAKMYVNLATQQLDATGNAVSLYGMNVLKIAASELNKLYNGKGFNLDAKKVDGITAEVGDNLFYGGETVWAFDVPTSGNGIVIENGVTGYRIQTNDQNEALIIPSGTYFFTNPVFQNGGSVATTDPSKINWLASTLIAVSPTETGESTDTNRAAGEGFKMITVKGSEFLYITNTSKPQGNDIWINNACFNVTSNYTDSYQYAISLPTFYYQKTATAAGTTEQSKVENVYLGVTSYRNAEQNVGTVLTESHVFDLSASSLVKGISLLNETKTPAIYTIKFVSGNSNLNNKYLTVGTDGQYDQYGYLVSAATEFRWEAKGAAIADVDYPIFQYVITAVDDENNVTFTNRETGKTFTTQLFNEGENRYSMSTTLNGVVAYTVNTAGANTYQVDYLATVNAGANVVIELTKLTEVDRYAGFLDAENGEIRTLAFARDKNDTSNKLYSIVDAGWNERYALSGEFANDIADAAQWQLVKKSTPEDLSRVFVYNNTTTESVDDVVEGDKVSAYKYALEYVVDGEATGYYLTNAHTYGTTGMDLKPSTNPLNDDDLTFIIKENVDGSISLIDSEITFDEAIVPGSSNQVVASYSGTKSIELYSWNTPNDASYLFSEEYIYTSASEARNVKTYLDAQPIEISWPAHEGHVTIESELGNYITMNEDRDAIVVNESDADTYYLYVTDKDAIVPSFYITKGVASENGERMFMFNPTDSVSYYVADGDYDRVYQWAENTTKVIFKAATINETRDTLTMDVKGETKYVAKEADDDNADIWGGINRFKWQIIEAADADGYYYIRQAGSDNVGNYLGAWNEKVTWSPDKAHAMLFTIESVAAPTVNESVSATEVKIIATDGAINIKNAAGKNVVISTILGQIVANEVLTSDNATISVPAGIAIVSVDGEEAVKVSVR